MSPTKEKEKQEGSENKGVDTISMFKEELILKVPIWDAKVDDLSLLRAIFIPKTVKKYRLHYPEIAQ